MKQIGLIGGMSWESTVPYYQRINRSVVSRLGGLHSARIILYSVDFAPIEQLQRTGNWHEAGVIVAAAARVLERAGADFLALCTNTMHQVADAIERAVEIPLLHVADATADEIRRQDITAVGLLGSRYTMELDFYTGRLRRQYGLDVLTPDEAARNDIQHVIYEELCQGKVRAASRERLRHIIADLAGRGAEGVILGCTELGFLVTESDSPVPLFDTTAIHAEAAAAFALASPDH